VSSSTFTPLIHYKELADFTFSISSDQWRRQLFWVGRSKGGQDIFRGQVYMVANNALRQNGTHTPLFQVFHPFPWSLFSLCLLWFLSFPPLFHSHLPPLPSFDTARGSGERCKLPQRVRAEPGRQMEFGEFWALKWAFSNMSNWQTTVFSKLSYICFWFSDSMNCSGHFTNAIFTNVSK